MRLSASKIKSLSDCSFKFYCNNVLFLPESQHPKTAAGSIVHSVFELLKKPSTSRKALYRDIVNSGTIYSSPSLTRLVSQFCSKNNVSEEISKDIDEMILLGLRHDFFHEGATHVYPPEYEFTLKTDEYELKGYIDVLAVYEGYCIIRDFKSQKLKFTSEELEFSAQSLAYQLCVKKQLDLPAKVEFILLRHPPTIKKPTNHIQTVEAVSQECLDGFENYLAYISNYLKDFTFEKATSNFCAANPKKAYFCKYVCQFRDPFLYYTGIKNGKKVSSKIKDGLEEVQEKFYLGCPYFNRPNYNGNKEAVTNL